LHQAKLACAKSGERDSIAMISGLQALAIEFDPVRHEAAGTGLQRVRSELIRSDSRGR
jgi:hypothetical protein